MVPLTGDDGGNVSDGTTRRTWGRGDAYLTHQNPSRFESECPDTPASVLQVHGPGPKYVSQWW